MMLGTGNLVNARSSSPGFGFSGVNSPQLSPGGPNSNAIGNGGNSNGNGNGGLGPTNISANQRDFSGLVNNVLGMQLEPLINVSSLQVMRSYFAWQEILICSLENFDTVIIKSGPTRKKVL